MSKLKCFAEMSVIQQTFISVLAEHPPGSPGSWLGPRPCSSAQPFYVGFSKSQEAENTWNPVSQEFFPHKSAKPLNYSYTEALRDSRLNAVEPGAWKAGQHQPQKQHSTSAMHNTALRTSASRAVRAFRFHAPKLAALAVWGCFQAAQKLKFTGKILLDWNNLFELCLKT